MAHSFRKKLSSHFYKNRYFWFILAKIIAMGVLFSLLHSGMHNLISQLPHEMESKVHFVYESMILALGIVLCWLYWRKRREYQDHIENETRLKLFIKHSPAAVAMLDRRMNYLIVSDRWIKDYNIQEQNIIGKNHYDVFPMIRENPMWLNDHRRALEEGEGTRREEDSFIGLSGKREWITYEILPWRDSQNRIGGLIFYTEVITPRMEILEKLRESEARFARAMRGSNDGVFDWDVQNNTVYFSPRFKRFLGYNEEEVANSYDGFISLLHPDDVQPIKQKVEDHVYRHEPYHVEYRLRKKSGDYVWIEARGQSEWDNNGNATYFSGAMTDISDRKRLESLRSEFVYVVTHELRTPLSVLRGALDMLPHLLGGELPQKAEKSLDLALQGCERLAVLVEDLLTAGSVEADQMIINPELNEIGTLLKAAVEMDQAYGEKYGVKFNLNSSLPHCLIKVDKGRFMQIMANLLSNAAKFSSEGSAVEVSAECDAHQVTISVHDFGQGIPEEFRRKIFQKFARGQTSRPGTGLGLNITKTMVEKMHGKIWFETELCKGTTFFVRFPLANVYA